MPAEGPGGTHAPALATAAAAVGPGGGGGRGGKINVGGDTQILDKAST